MASIPLPALGVRPPDQSNGPLQVAGQMLSLRSMVQGQQMQQQQLQAAQQENQLRAMQIQDQQAWRKVFTDPSIDFTSPDASQTMMRKAAQNGASGQSIFQMRGLQLDYQSKLANKTKTDLENEQTVHDQARGQVLSAIQSQDPQQKQQIWGDVVTRLQSNGAVPQGILPPQYPGDQQATVVANNLALGSTLAKEAIERQASAARALQSRYRTVNGTLWDMGDGNQPPKVALPQNLDPNEWGKLVDSVVPAQGANAQLNARTKSQVNFYVGQGNIEAAQKAITDAGQQIGAIEKETNPQVLNARVNQAVNTEVQKAKALAPELAQVTRTTQAGRQYISADDAQGESGKFIRQQAAAAGIPVVDKDTASTLADIDTAKQNQAYMLSLIGPKLAASAAGRLGTAPANTIEKLAQTDPELASIGTFRNAAIQSMRAVAGSKGLRINQAEIQMAIDNDIPKMTDTLPAAAQKLKNLQTFLDNSESAHLTYNRGQLPGGALPRGNGRVIDKATAMQFYNAAGGDPNKARVLATQSGWKVQ